MDLTIFWEDPTCATALYAQNEDLEESAHSFGLYWQLNDRKKVGTQEPGFRFYSCKILKKKNTQKTSMQQ